jgi:hypothetical protein
VTQNITCIERADGKLLIKGDATNCMLDKYLSRLEEDRRKLMSRTVTGTILEATELPVESSCIFLSEELQLEHERCEVARKELQERPKRVIDDS